jgi:hypothetical protein
VSFDAIVSIACQLHQQRMKKLVPRLREDIAAGRLVSDFLRGSSVEAVCTPQRLPVYILTKLFVENLMRVDPRTASKIMRDPACIEHARLRREVRGGLARVLNCLTAAPHLRMVAAGGELRDAL